MRDFPTDPMRQHRRFMAAFCDDILAGEYHAPRAKAVAEISRQINEQPRDGSGNAAGGNPLPSNS